MKKYGYLGPKGTHSEEALDYYLGSIPAEKIPYPGIEQALIAVKNGEVTNAIVPLENSVEGTVNIVLDIIARDNNLQIAGEVILPIRHHLLVKPGTRKSDIKLIISHPQALAQCRQYLNNNFPDIDIREAASTAIAAKLVSESSEALAAIAGEKAANNFRLDTLNYDIQDCRDNQTRFVDISRGEAKVSGPSKTSLVISITDRPGGLYQILKEFALSNINLTKIESRPAKRNLGDYLFFIDLEGHKNEPHIKKCLEEISNMAASFRILGSYLLWAKPDKTANDPQKAGLSVEELRHDIDIIDYQIVELLAKRTQLVTLIGTMKYGRDSVRDKERELEVINRVRQNALKKGVNPELTEKVYLMLFEHFVELQKKIQDRGIFY